MSTSSEWQGEWSKSALCKNNGFIIEGSVVSTRIHSVFLRSTAHKDAQEDQLPTRFVAVIVKVDLSVKRNFDANGYEIPPKTVKAKAVGKGHLNHFEKVDASLVEQVNNDELAKSIGKGSALPDGFHNPGRDKLHPKVPGHFEFWADMEKFSSLWKDLKVGEAVRIRTIGDSVFVDSLAKQDSLGVPHFTGDPKLGMAWTDKIVSAHSSVETTTAEDDDDDEWK
eukprot:TRINITY_DN1496_c1_g1_i3.p2 TRINITY_DN1496_c1_g1~~TRINITY_DN1496_c1_g1_i3.p2  ORF type:complete len:224 (-),score=82.21 TRINITY_DN1496_c1_g1_i3:69-740(-)